MSRTVADELVGTLDQLGVKQLFGLIGDSLNPLADAIRRSRIEWMGVRHEEGAALAAAGQAKFTGRLAVRAGTTGPGSNHLVPGLYEAARDHAPVLAISGDMARKLRGTDYIQTTEPDLLFRDVSLYTETVASVHHELPIKVVIYDNSAFGLIPLEAEAAGLPRFREGIEFPNPDFAALARACGGQGFKVTRPSELRDAISEALATEGPTIVDVVVAADEMPNLPHLDLGLISHFTMAKVKEAVLAVTGA
jgi:thiamine pyrophosphate-dependent acetolactate synthase large subunit-like protein